MSTQQQELLTGCVAFFNFSLNLLEGLNAKSNNLKFAVVNMQVAVELYLKYFFIRLNKPEKVFTDLLKRDRYRDFSDILSAYFHEIREDHMVEKRHLRSIMESRNNIVHKGRFDEWDDDLAAYVIDCVFFIQSANLKAFGERFVQTGYFPHKLSKNTFWKKRAEKMALKHCEGITHKRFECPHCLATALIPKGVVESRDTFGNDDLECLSCFTEIDTSTCGTLINCCACGKEGSYYLDKMNEQSDQSFGGKCLACGVVMEVRLCAFCSEYYYPDVIESEIHRNGFYFCSADCEMGHAEVME
jgi:hypothetical protein